MKKTFLLIILFVAISLGGANKIFAQDSYIGDIKLTAITFNQSGWLECNGQLLQISEHTALYSLLGTTYGGNGSTNFALPDLRGRVPVGLGTGPGLATYNQGQKGGVEGVTLTANQLPAHTHGVSVSTSAGTSFSPDGTFLANTGNFDKEYSATANTVNTVMVQSAGGNIAHENRQPYTVVRYVICVNGLYPSRP